MESELQLQPAGILLGNSDQEGGLKPGRFVDAIKRNILLVVGAATLTASAAVFKAVTDVPTYQSSFELLTPPTTLETQIISTLNPEALSNQSEIISVAIDETKLKILKSPRVMEPVVEQLSERYPNISYGEVVGGLDLIFNAAGNTLTVEYASDDPELVLDVLEIVSKAYLEYSLADRQNDISRGIDFVDEQLPIAKERVEGLEEELESLRQGSNLIDPLVQGQQLSTKAAEFTAEQLNLRVQIQETEELYENLQNELSADAEFAVTSALLENGRYQDLINQLTAIDQELAEELTLYLEGSPEIDVIRERRENLQPLLEREGFRVQRQVANVIRELQVRDQALTAAIDTLNQQIKALSTTTRQYNNIQRQLEIATTNLNQFLTKREALRIDAAQRQTPWEILTSPGNPKASSASAKRNLILGTVLGVMLGSGVAVLVDRITGKIHTIEELRETAQLPLLGTIPHERLLEDKQSLTLSMSQLSQLGSAMNLFMPGAHNDDDSKYTSPPFFEAFKILATNLQLSSPDNPIKALTISSAIPNMGKSTISFHLGHAVAGTGQRVLIVDTDLRRPTIHKLANLSNEKGLSNYSSGEFELDDVLVSLPLEPNLYVLPVGPTPPDPVKILTSQRAEDFFNTIHQRFDFVIFDTPPLLGFADSFIVSAKTQGILLTATLGKIKFSQLQSALDELSIAKVPMLGIVANGARSDSSKSYGYYNYNYYHQFDDEFDGVFSNGKDSKGAWYETPLNLLSKSLGNKR